MRAGCTAAPHADSEPAPRTMTVRPSTGRRPLYLALADAPGTYTDGFSHLLLAAGPARARGPSSIPFILRFEIWPTCRHPNRRQAIDGFPPDARRLSSRRPKSFSSLRSREIAVRTLAQQLCLRSPAARPVRLAAARGPLRCRPNFDIASSTDGSTADRERSGGFPDHSHRTPRPRRHRQACAYLELSLESCPSALLFARRALRAAPGGAMFQGPSVLLMSVHRV
jgi:hypothetical protein